jgi:class 3 adenylate cyclase/tetratricopeptide (TPR) repeat protein
MSACAVCGYKSVEAFKFCPECGAAAATQTSEQRRVVTVLFCDVVGSTALGESADPEAVRATLARYFESMRAIVERHGGTVEKFIGDAVMAVFGVPVAHEDDAMRACRAAVEMQDALPALAVEGRIGVATGEVVTGTKERLATGDAVNLAARLQQAARPGEALVEEGTRALVGAAAELEAVEPLALKGKAEPVSAFRLRAVHEAERPPEAPFVGRERELAAIHGAWKRALSGRRCELVTIVGEAGVGKSRLVTEALASLEARSVQGRCLPYGEGITYWPVVEILKQLGILPLDRAAATAIRSLLGDTSVATSAEEIAWAFRKTLEQAAAERPLIVVLDDIQWGEETFLDLLEHVALLSSGDSILVLAMARPELTERRASWPVTLRVEPLGAKEVEELIPVHISGGLRGKIARVGGGNPLFVEEMVAMAGEAGEEVVVPPTLQALLATRLDQLDPAERRALERAAVEGEVFHRGAVQALAGEEAQVTPRLASLVRKGLIHPEKPQLPGEDGFRFRHLLIRDAAYASLPKAARAELHQRFAGWLDDRGTQLVEQREILGYHLERAWHYRDELGLADDGELAEAARRHLAASGSRALWRQDIGAAVNLLARAAALVPSAETNVSLELDLAHALGWAGKAGESLQRARSVAERAAAAGDRRGELCALLSEGMMRTFFEPEGAADQLAPLTEQALPEFEAAHDDFALNLAYRALGQVAGARGQMDALVAAYERAAAHAQRVGLPNQLQVFWCSYGRFYGPTPLSELLAWQDEQDELSRRSPRFRAHRAQALAMLGRLAEARAMLAELRADVAERGGHLTTGGMSTGVAFEVELLAGDPAAAVAAGEEDCRILEDAGWKGALSSAAGTLANAYYELGRLEEADAWAERAAELGASDDANAQMLWRLAKAKVLARRGEHAEAERLAQEALEICEATDMLNDQAIAFADLAEVLALAGRPEAAAEALEQALVRYGRKENVVMANRVRASLADLRQGRWQTRLSRRSSRRRSTTIDGFGRNAGT